MRFVGALEGVLDPIVALLDTLPAHFDPELAPLDLLDLATKWLGLEHNEAQPASQLRNLVRHTAELGRLRGTRAGVEMALALNFPELPLRVEDGGGVVVSTSGDPPKPAPPVVRRLLRHADLAGGGRRGGAGDRGGEAGARRVPVADQGGASRGGGLSFAGACRGGMMPS